MTEDEIELLRLAVSVNSSLKKVDSEMMGSGNKPAANIDPRKFVRNLPQKPNTTNQTFCNDNILVMPKSNYIGSDVVDKVPDNIGAMLIPMPEGITEPSLTIPPPPQLPPAPVASTIAPVLSQPQIITHPSNMLDISNKLDIIISKLDLLLTKKQKKMKVSDENPISIE